MPHVPMLVWLLVIIVLSLLTGVQIGGYLACRHQARRWDR